MVKIDAQRCQNRSSKQAYIFMECDRDIKMLYQVIYNMMGKHSINPLPD